MLEQLGFESELTSNLYVDCTVMILPYYMYMYVIQDIIFLTFRRIESVYIPGRTSARMAIYYISTPAMSM